jgi:hypothetical protein
LQELREQMSQLEQLVTLPLIAQRDQQLHEAVLTLMHLALPMLEQALPLPVQVLMVLLQLHERLVVSALEQQVLLVQPLQRE